MKVYRFPGQFALPRLCSYLFCILFHGAVIIPGYISAQTVPLQFTPIPYSAPDIVSPGRGAEQWQNGSESVNYPLPDTNYKSLDVYYRFPWTRLEDSVVENYNWTYFDNLVKDAIDNGQKISFGIMPVYDGGGTVFYDSAKSAYPLYIHKAMQAGAENTRDWISNGVWIPNWNHNYYLSRLKALHVALNTHILRTSHKGVPFKNAIYCIDIRGYGNYGEWHSAGIVDNVNKYPTGRRATLNTLKTIINHHTQVFKDWPLSLMIAVFDAEQYDAIMNPAELTHYALTTSNEWGPLGWRRDQWGATDPYLDKILKNNEKTFGNSVPFKELITKRYLTAPVTGEPPSYINPGGPCEYWDLENQLIEYGATSLGNGNWGKKLSPCGEENARAAFKRAGYRIILEGGSISDILTAGKPFSIRLAWKNIGVAPTYENWDVFYELKNESNLVVWSGISSFKPKLFAPNEDSTIIQDDFVLPTDVEIGKYNLNLVIKDPTGYRAPLPLAIYGRNIDGSYTLKEDFVVSPAICEPPTAVISSTAACNDQLPTLVLDTASGAGPYNLVINGTIYHGINVGDTITTLTAPIEKIWSENPTVNSYIDAPVELGLKFKATVPGMITGIRFFSSNQPTGVYTGHLWTGAGTLIGSVEFNNVTPSEWQEAKLGKPVTTHPDSTYVVSYHSSTGYYASTPAGLKQGIKKGHIVVEEENTTGGHGVYMYGASGSFPTYSYNAANYWADVIFSPSVQQYTFSGITDANDCSNMGIDQTIAVDFTNVCDTIPLPGPVIELTARLDHTPACTGEPFNLVLDSANGTGPYELIINGVTYSDISVGQTITTINSENLPSQSVWQENPVVNQNIDAPVELGMKFTTTVAGSVTGIRFFSPNDPNGIYTGHLWSSTGELLNSVVFDTVTPGSWQEAYFTSPVKLNPGSSYVVSYHTSTGHYVSTQGGLKNGAGNGTLIVHGENIEGSNGVYMYGPAGSFPSYSFNSSNYWADIVFAPDSSIQNIFKLTSITDSNGLNKTGALQTLEVIASDNCDEAPGDEAEPEVVLGYSTDCSTNSVALVLDSANGSAPYDLVINGVLYEDIMPGQTITTVTAPSKSIWDHSPAIVSAEDQPVELGMKFTSSVDGYIKGVRFFSPYNSEGVYTGHLWSTSGELLASAEFGNVSPGGWQEILFQSPVFIKANTIYIASYHTAGGRYASTPGGLKDGVSSGTLTALGDNDAGGNGVYRYGVAGSFPDFTYNANNYWVDVVFATENSFSYTFDLTSVKDQTGKTKTGSLHTLSVNTPDCEESVITASRSSDQSNMKEVAVAKTTRQITIENNLEQNYPNPFSQTSTIKYSLAKPGTVNLALYDVHGRLVKSLVNGWNEAGTYTVQLEKTSLQGGLYFYKMQTSGFSAARKLIVQ